MRPRETLSPTSAQSPAGKRIEPAPSAALAIGTTRAATALAAPPLEPPGVWSGCQGLRVSPKSGGFRLRAPAALGRRGLRHQQEARRLRARHGAHVEGRHVVPEHPAALGRERARVVHEAVLEEEGHAHERPGRNRACGKRPSQLVAPDRDEIELRIDGLDPLDGRIHHLGGGHLAIANEPAETERIVVSELARNRHWSLLLTLQSQGCRRFPDRVNRHDARSERLCSPILMSVAGSMKTLS